MISNGPDGFVGTDERQYCRSSIPEPEVREDELVRWQNMRRTVTICGEPSLCL